MSVFHQVSRAVRVIVCVAPAVCVPVPDTLKFAIAAGLTVNDAAVAVVTPVAVADTEVDSALYNTAVTDATPLENDTVVFDPRLVPLKVGTVPKSALLGPENISV